jgi:DNA replication and repair protein RecF
MYLSKLEIVNFKSFAEVSFDFHPQVNVLTGVNNAGKTTVLEALAHIPHPLWLFSLLSMC